jgi:uncharacterized protein YjaG (DUF416 family)
MITYKEFTRQFKLQTESLVYQKQFELAVSICRKLFFDYQKFSEDNNWGEPDLLLDAIRFIEQSKGLKIDVALSKEKISRIEEIAPDTEDFGDACYALNCCVAVCETLKFLTDHKAEHIYSIGTCLTDTIDFRIQEDDQLTETEIDGNPNMVEARKFLLEMSR